MCQQREPHHQIVKIQHFILFLFPNYASFFFASRSMLTEASIKHSELPEYGHSTEVLVFHTLKR